jgi:HlyD family secretion protein
MRRGEDAQQFDGPARRWAGDSPSDRLGPQGAALILELQRLRRAYEDENPKPARAEKPPRPARDGAPRRPPPTRPKRRQKGKVERAIDVCLEQFGFKAADPAPRRNEISSEPAVPPLRRNEISSEPAVLPLRRNETSSAPAAPSLRRNETSREPAAPPPRRPGRGVRSDEPLSMNLSKLGPDSHGPDRLMLIESPPLALPRASEADKAARQLVARCRAGLTSGVGFILGRESQAEQDAAAGDSLMSRTGWAYQHELRTGLRILLIAGVLGGGWLALVPLAGAVVVPGNLVVQSNVKTIQHPTGGVVAEIKVHDGMHVSAGDLLVRLDATQTQANLQMVNKQLDELRARIARLTAERDGLDRPEIPAELAARSGEDNVRSLLTSENSLFKARFNARKSQKDLLQSRVAQLSEQISGLDAQVDSKAKQLELIAGELTGVQDLYDKHLVPLTRLTTLQREAARIEGERGQLTSSIAETKSKIGEAQLQIVRIDQDFRTDVVKELGETQGKEAELSERSVAAQDQLDRIEIRAPTSGVIHQLAMHTIGGVIRASDTIMEVVPDSDDLLVETRLQPNDIDQVRLGQKAFVRFSAFNQRTTPQLAGTVSYVSANTSHDQGPQGTQGTQGGAQGSYFTVRIVLPDQERRRLGSLQLVPGMPAEVFMQTGSRTMMSYLLKPITDQMQRAFVEQ